jgi:hypothetical protein
VQFKNVTGNAQSGRMRSLISSFRGNEIVKDCRHVPYLLRPTGRRRMGGISQKVQSAPAWPFNSVEALPMPFKGSLDYHQDDED